MEPIRILLTSTICQLENLQIMNNTAVNINSGDDSISCFVVVDIQEFLQALSNNKSLKSFRTNYWIFSGERPFSNLLAALLQSHPTWKSLHLHQRFTIQDIQEATSSSSSSLRQITFPRRLVQISNPKFIIRSAPADGTYEKAIESFLDVHLKVSLSLTTTTSSQQHCSNNNTWPQQSIGYANQLNLAGRYLLRRGRRNNNNVPAGLWPLVLARIATATTSSKRDHTKNIRNIIITKDDHQHDDNKYHRTSILYEFLHAGPALVGIIMGV